MTYDKSDLQREEIEQYISLASEIVTTEQIDRGIQFLDQQMEGLHGRIQLAHSQRLMLNLNQEIPILFMHVELLLKNPLMEELRGLRLHLEYLLQQICQEWLWL